MTTTKHEIWRPVKRYEGLYEISNAGRVRTLHTMYSKCIDADQILAQNINGAGYYVVGLCKKGIVKTELVHRLVAEAFCENSHGYKYVHHKDENKRNNNADNLMWCTCKQNLQFSNVHIKLQAAARESQKKSVIMYDKDGTEVRRFSSMTEAAKYIGDYQQNISACIYGKIKAVKGYSFKLLNC